MVVTGHPARLDAWGAAGLPGRSFQTIKPHSLPRRQHGLGGNLWPLVVEHGSQPARGVVFGLRRLDISASFRQPRWFGRTLRELPSTHNGLIVRLVGLILWKFLPHIWSGRAIHSVRKTCKHRKPWCPVFPLIDRHAPAIALTSIAIRCIGYRCCQQSNHPGKAEPLKRFTLFGLPSPIYQRNEVCHGS